MKTLFLLLSITLLGCGVEETLSFKENPNCSLKLNLYDLSFTQIYNNCPFNIDIPLHRERQVWIDGLVCGTHISSYLSEKNGLEMICNLRAVYTETSLELFNYCNFYNNAKEFCKYAWIEYNK